MGASANTKMIFNVVVGLTLASSVINTSVKGIEEEVGNDSEPPHGLGNRIAWQTIEEGHELAKQQKKPLMLLIHKSWCGACKSLKPKIKESDEVLKLSEKFVMASSLDEEEPTGADELYKPDGGYIPRILFFSADGTLLKEVINDKGNPDYQYYYYEVDSIVSSMKRVIRMLAASDNQNKLDPSDKENRNSEL